MCKLIDDVTPTITRITTNSKELSCLKNTMDFILHALEGVVVFFASAAPAGLLIGWTTQVILTGSISAIICAGAIGYIRELEQLHYNGGNRWNLFGLSTHKHVEALGGCPRIDVVARGNN